MGSKHLTKSAYILGLSLAILASITFYREQNFRRLDKEIENKKAQNKVLFNQAVDLAISNGCINICLALGFTNSMVISCLDKGKNPHTRFSPDTCSLYDDKGQLLMSLPASKIKEYIEKNRGVPSKERQDLVEKINRNQFLYNKAVVLARLNGSPNLYAEIGLTNEAVNAYMGSGKTPFTEINPRGYSILRDNGELLMDAPVSIVVEYIKSREDASVHEEPQIKSPKAITLDNMIL